MLTGISSCFTHLFYLLVLVNTAILILVQTSTGSKNNLLVNIVLTASSIVMYFLSYTRNIATRKIVFVKLKLFLVIFNFWIQHIVEFCKNKADKIGDNATTAVNSLFKEYKETAKVSCFFYYKLLLFTLVVSFFNGCAFFKPNRILRHQ